MDWIWVGQISELNVTWSSCYLGTRMNSTSDESDLETWLAPHKVMGQVTVK